MTFRFSHLRIFAIAGFVVTVSLALATPVRAIESFGIGAVPANPRADTPRSKSIFVYQAEPGKVLSDGVKVINNTDQQRTIKVYPVDSQRSSDGAFACAQAADAKKEVGTWVNLAKSQVALPPNGNETIPFSLTLPPNAEVGEHNGCIAIEEDKPQTQNAGNGIVLSFRSALRIAVTVPGEIFANLEFVELKTEVKDKVAVSPVIKNTGNVSVDANLHIGLSNVFGGKVAGAEGQFAVLHKDESRFNFELDRPFWGGWYKIDATADYEILQESPDKTQSKRTLTTQPQWIFVAPQLLAAIIYVVTPIILVAGVIVYVFRKRHWKTMHQRTINYPVKAGDNLQTIAAKAHVDWKKLVKLNQLKPPYTLQPGEIIKIPYAKQSATESTKTKKG